MKNKATLRSILILLASWYTQGFDLLSAMATCNDDLLKSVKIMSYFDQTKHM